MSKNTGTSELINYFDLGANGDVGIAGSLDINTIANATTDTDTFLVSDTGIIKYRTGAQILSDIGGQGALTNPVTGTGTTNYLPKFTGASTIGNSQVFDNGTNVGIGTNSPSNKLDVLGSAASPNLVGTNAYSRFYQSGGYANVTIGALASGSFAGWIQTSDGVGTAIALSLQPSGGNLLVGTTTDNGARLQVSGAGTFADIVRASSTIAQSLGEDGSAGPVMRLTSTNSNANSRNWAIINSYDNFGDLTFRVSNAKDGNAVSAGTSRMVILSSGNVGIGLNSPQTFLHVFGANTANRGQLSIQSNNVSNGARATFYYDTFNAGEIGTTGSDLYALATNNLIFYASGDIRMQIKGSNVLIGSSTDDGPRLKVLRPNDSGSIIRIGNSDSTYFDFSRNQTNGALSIQGNQIGFNNICLAPSGGNVGIGTASPNLTAANRTVLDINGTSNSLLVFSSGGTYKSYIYNDGIGLTLQASTLQFETSFIPRIHVTSGGNVGINTVLPNEKLEVSGAIAATGTASTAIPSSSTMDYFSGATRFISRGGNNSTRGSYRFLLEAANGSLSIDGLAITSSGILTSLPTYNNVTGVSANVQIDSNGYFARSTSSLKYKTDIVNYDKGLAEVLKMRPVYYKSINEREKDLTFAGLIAEEIEELGLTEFVQYAEDGTPDALSYSNMVALLVKAIQEQQVQIDKLKNL